LEKAMSLLNPQDGPGFDQVLAFEMGTKLAADKSPAMNLKGMLFVSEHRGKHWGLLSVPNAMVRGVFQAMHEPGAELPEADGALDAHITVFRPEEIEEIGGTDKLKGDRGKQFTYTIQKLESFVPSGWADTSRVWALRVYSPELQELRRSYGLASKPKNDEFDFHITIATRKVKVTRSNSLSKVE
jgi:hypothetical protein